LNHRSENKGSIFYVVMVVLGVLATVASVLVDMSGDEAYATQLTYRSEIALNLAEGIAEEFFHNVELTMNEAGSGPIGGVYDKLRETSSEGDSIELDEEYIGKYLVQNSMNLCNSMNTTTQPRCAAWVQAQITNIRPLDINPVFKTEGGEEQRKPGLEVDPIEKDAVLQVLVRVVYEEYEKKLVITRSLKVVNTTVAPMSVFTLFLNDPGFPYLAQWSSKLGMDYENDRKEQKSLILDHSWDMALGGGVSRDEFAAAFDARFMNGHVPPGRVFVNTGIVPLTNGNRESGVLQNAFFTAESELLPPGSVMDLSQKEQFLVQVGSRMTNETERQVMEEAIPDSGEIHTRYIGHGYEIRARDDYEVNGKKRSGFLRYMEAFSEEWANDPKRKNPSMSGLDLFGRVEYKPGALDDEPAEEGFFGRIFQAVGDAFNSALDAFVDDNYNLRIMPTVVYGQALASYFRVLDYKYTRAGELQKVWEAREERENEDRGWLAAWWDGITDITANLLRSVKVGFLGPGQYAIPEVRTDLWEGLSDEELKQSFTEDDRGKFKDMGWSDETFEDFLDLPDELRKPIFFKFFGQMRQNSLEYFEKDFSNAIPRGATLAPFNNSILNYVRPDRESPFFKWMTDSEKGLPAIGKNGLTVIDNPLDQQMDTEWGGEYKSPLKGILHPEAPLKSFNPFLYYRKATDYVSSIYDYRAKAETDREKNVLWRKYHDEESSSMKFEGVIYITGTANPLKFSEFLEPGKDYVEYSGKAIIITFGEVIFDVGVRKKGFSTQQGKIRHGNDAPLLTVIALGGIQFHTSDWVQASVYSFMYPPRSTHEFKLHGTLGCSELKLDQMKLGGVVKFDGSHYINNLSAAEKRPYYFVALTDEIKDYSWKAAW